MISDIFQKFVLLLQIFDFKSHSNSSNFTVYNSSDLTIEFSSSFEINENLTFPTTQHKAVSLFPKCCQSNHPVSKYFSCNDTDEFFPVIKDYHDKHWDSLTVFPSSEFSDITLELSLPKCVKGHKYIKLDANSTKMRYQGRFLQNGYFGYDNEYYSPLEYCINGLTGEFVEVKICEPECSKERPCIQKCCDPDEIYSFSQRRCIKSNPVLYNPIFYHDMSNILEEQERKKLQPHFSIRFPRAFKYHCQENTTQIFPSGNPFAQFLSNSTGRKYFPADFRLRKDGTIMYRKDGKAIVLPDRDGYPIFLQDNKRKCYTLKTEHYCIDGATEYGNPNDFMNNEGETFLVTCSEYLYEAPVIGPLSFVYGNVMIGSSFFSLFTVVTYLILTELQNLHGWTIVSYTSSVFFMYNFLGLAHLIRYYGSDEVLKTDTCVIIGIASHFFSLSSFFWLTMMNWDLWWTFRKIRPAVKSSRDPKLKLWHHYLKYSMFGWGFPLMIISASSYLHFNYEQVTEDDCAEVGFPLPGYGRQSCEIKQLSLGVYLYVPATALLFCNLLFFSITIYSLCKHERTTLIAVKSLERHHQSVMLFFKLFCVMGVTRVFEVITWAESGPTLTWYWAVFDIFNVLQAVAIFIIYVCKKDVILSLKKKLSNKHSLIKGKEHTVSSKLLFVSSKQGLNT